MPSTLIDARRISRHHGARTLLDAIDLRVDAGSRIALIGSNGSGKSTLLRILAGVERPDGGAVRAHGTVGYLPELASETTAGGHATVRATILERIGVAAAGRRLDAVARRLEGGDLAAVEPHAAALEGWLALGGDDADARLRAAAADLGLGPPACSTGRSRRSPAARRRAPGSPPCGRRASTSCSSTSRRTTSTPTASSASARCWPSAPAASCSSHTTARCSPRPRPSSSSSTSAPAGPRTTRAAGTATSASATPPGGARSTRTSGRSAAARSSSRPSARSAAARTRASVVRSARRATATRTRRSG